MRYYYSFKYGIAPNPDTTKRRPGEIPKDPAFFSLPSSPRTALYPYLSVPTPASSSRTRKTPTPPPTPSRAAQ